MSGTTDSRDSRGAGVAGVEDMAKDFWATRPRRPRRGRKIAGVAAGIAARYRVDPTLVRVGLVVAAIYGGAGIVVYLLGWLFLPEQDDEVSPFESMLGRGRSTTSTGFTLLLCLAMIPTVNWFLNGFFPGYLGLLVVAGLLYLLHRTRGHLRPDVAAPAAAHPAPPTPPTPPTPPVPPTPPTAATSTGSPGGVTAPLPEQTPEQTPEQAPERADQEPTTPPSWDPLGAAPFAWDLPDPNPPQPEPEPQPPRQHRSRVGLVTVGIALIVGAVLSMWMGDWISPQHVIGVMLAVLGLGMVVGSFVRGGRGLVGLAAPLAVIGVGMTVVTPGGWNGVGEIDDRPTRISQVSPEYRKSIGSIQLDLRGLPASGEVRTRIDLGMGDATVILPEDADVQLSCETAVGSVSCLGEEWSGVNKDDRVEVLDEGDDGPGGLEVDMVIDVGTGSVEVRRG